MLWITNSCRRLHQNRLRTETKIVDGVQYRVVDRLHRVGLGHALLDWVATFQGELVAINIVKWAHLVSISNIKLFVLDELKDQPRQTVRAQQNVLVAKALL